MIKYLIDFLKNKNIEDKEVFKYLKCSNGEAEMLKYLTREYVEGSYEVLVLDVLKDIFGEIKTWVDGEIEAKRFRITDNNFRAFLGNKIEERLGSLSDSNSHLSKFPGNGELFFNQ